MMHDEVMFNIKVKLDLHIMHIPATYYFKLNH